MAKPKKNVVEYRVYELPLKVPALALHGEKWRISDRLSNRLHFHNCMEIGFCHTDSGMLQFEGQSVSFSAGDVTIIPRHVPHTTCSHKGTKSLWSYLFIDLMGLLSDMLPMENLLDPGAADWLPQHFLFTQAQHPRIHFLANCLLEEFKGDKTDRVRVIKSLSLALYHELLRLLNEERRPKQEQTHPSFVLKPALEYIHLNYMNPTTTKQLSDICHLSETHFRRLFLSIMGTSPQSFINATRMNQACVLLDTTDLPILSIAEAVGISAISSFNRNFHQIMGISPRGYRQAASKAHINPRHKSILIYKGWLAAEDHPEHMMPDNPGAP